jgi:hypothetical protein
VSYVRAATLFTWLRSVRASFFSSGVITIFLLGG